MALLDNGVQVNTITPRYVQEHSLPVGPITDLMDSKVACVGLGNPRPFSLCKKSAHHLGDPYYWESCECDEGGRDGYPCHTVGKCQGGTTPGCA